jgi:proteasome activator subunit 4
MVLLVYRLLQERFIAQERRVRLPKKSDSNYAETMLTLHSAILGLCALIDCFPYVVEDWMPPLMEGLDSVRLVIDVMANYIFVMVVLARHSADRPPISTTIRTMASEFKKTHQVGYYLFVSSLSCGGETEEADNRVQDTWQTDKLAFTEDELQALNTILVGTSYCKI